MVYEKRICVIKLQGEYFYTASIRKRGFLWRGIWKELTPTMQSSYEGAFELTKRFDKNVCGRGN
jgi:hypothetical protein